jgi:hypothetical protein
MSIQRPRSVSTSILHEVWLNRTVTGLERLVLLALAWQAGPDRCWIMRTGEGLGALAHMCNMSEPAVRAVIDQLQAAGVVHVDRSVGWDTYCLNKL